MERQYIVTKGPYGTEQLLYFTKLKQWVNLFNRKAKESDLDFRIRLTEDSETYCYYAELVLPDRSKIPFLIDAMGNWGMYGRTDFSQAAMDLYYQAWYLWKS